VAADGDGIELDEETATRLQHWVRSSSTQQRLVRRSRIVLLLASGLSQAAAAQQLGVSRRTVALWKQRFLEGGAAALQRDRPGRGRPKGRRPGAVSSIMAAMTIPPDGHDRWTARALAKQVGVSHSTVLRVWRDAKI
jgi:transposase-like protein